MSSMTHISPKVRNIRQSELGALGRRANQIKEELRQGVQKPYKHLIDVSWGDSHRAGVKPLTFVRQVLAACLYPQLVNSDKLPVDVRERAQRLLEACDGGSVGSYTSTAGIFSVLQNVAKFISHRDGGIPSHPDNIFITPGSQWSIMKILSILVNSENSPSTAVLVPTPCSSSVSMTLEGLGATIVPYYLDEEQGWELHIGELHRALQSAKEVCNPAVLYVNNPGNPTVVLPCISHTLTVATIGHVQSRKSIEEVVKFASEQKLFIIADEVYQDSVIEEGMEFVSYKRVLAEMGSPLSDTVELASFHSASKGCMGECGLRGGYVELANLDPAVLKYIYTVFSTDSCAPVTGQMALDLMVNPPRPGDPSYPVFNQEMQNIRAMLVHNVKRVLEVLNSLPGFSCQPVKGGASVFPRLHLPPGAVQKATELGMPPDVFYCGRLLEEAGLCVGPGCEHGQREGSYHIRFSVMASADTVEEGLRRLTSFHLEFTKEFS